MDYYLSLKWLHILSSVVLVGTGFGSAFYLFFAHRTKNVAAIAVVVRLVVRADFWFTTPTIVIQPASGFALVYIAGFSLSQAWLTYALLLYVIAGMCWLPVVWLQIQMARIAEQCVEQALPLPDKYWQYAKYWERLGYPAFLAMVVVFWLMVFKPS